jgi:hypothetical protein
VRHGGSPVQHYKAVHSEYTVFLIAEHAYVNRHSTLAGFIAVNIREIKHSSQVIVEYS